MKKPQNWTNFLSDEAKLRNPSALKKLHVHLRKPGVVSLGGGLPHQSVFPCNNISIDYPTVESNFTNFESVALGELPNTSLYESLQYGPSIGSTYLSKWVKTHTASIHNPPYKNWDTIITAGSTQSLDAVLRTICNQNDTILIEEQTYPTALETAIPFKLNVVPVALDSGGIVAEKLDNLLTNWHLSSKSIPKPKLIYTMPTGQNPTGITMSLERRKQFYRVCQKHDILIVEDEPYYFLQLGSPVKGEFTSENFTKNLVPSLLSLDTDGRVVRLDSFSKVMLPGSRTSWVTANEIFVERILRQNEVNIQTASGISQLIIYTILTKWGDLGYLKWLEKIRLLYTSRRDSLMKSFEKYLPKDLCSWNCPASGMFLWIKIDIEKFPKPSKDFSEEQWASIFEEKVYEKTIDNNVILAKGGWFIVPPSEKLKTAGFRATYASATVEDMNKAAERLAKTLIDLKNELSS
ncbi:PLP-dependent aminotransferase family protein [Ascoidea rubescens DSM 1968]|uniref:PLP-dependent transferase n=1 Tax=Ascoidea rubescens DSM 1968 TaxID=1344418 RepID=A0A1D2VR70_9ASCO|nr:PLP-dependent transferase [Ascoidea rubescens DSM 1968]ODV64113.1 PLP-dependent transferase [Ascoidea rubescens DSM 1968]